MAENLGPRWRHLAAVIRGERAVTAAARSALDDVLTYGAAALAAAGYDDATLDARALGWGRITERAIFPPIAAVFDAAFDAIAAGTLDPAPYGAAHLATVENRLSGIPDEVFDNMRTVLAVGREAGEGIPQLAARVDALLADDERWTSRAETIARTEVIGANNAGGYASARASAELLGSHPDEVVKEWLATSDSRTRESHAAADGQQVRGLDTPFVVGGDTLAFAADPAGSPEEVINCRCTVLYRYPGDPEYPTGLSAGRGPSRVGPAPTVPLSDDGYDRGPQTSVEATTRGMAPEELAAETRTRGGIPRAAARAELRRRGLSAAGQEPDVTDALTAAPEDVEGPTHAGLAVYAADTGRVLMLQRSLDPTDAPDVAGTWEFPGGGIEDDETPYDAACREFSEETGLPVPEGEVTADWLSADGVYQGFVLTVPAEADAFAELNPDLAAAETINPDDPQRRTPDVTAWFTLEQVQGLGAALRPEVHATPWDVFITPTEEDPVDPDTPTPRPITAEELRAAAADQDVAQRLASGLVMSDDGVLLYAGPELVAALPEDQPTPPDAPALAQEIASDGEPFYGIACPEDVLSGDRRLFTAGAITWRDLPLPLMFQDAQMPGHDGAVRVARIDVMERDTSGPVPVIRYSGVWDTSPAAIEARRQVAAGVARGVSVDCTDVTVQLTTSDGTVLDPMVDDFPDDGVVIEAATEARVAGVTICSVPAFHQAYIANGRLEDRTDPEPGMTEVGDPAPPVDVEDPETVVAAAWSLVAASGVVHAAADFADPGLTEPTRMTVTPDGRVYGHLATWGTCHIGIRGMCQEPPASASNYAYFATGSVPVDGGGRVAVGQLTMDTGHAAMGLRAAPAVAHYDNTGTVVADVSMGQDHIGIWFAGRLRAGVTPEQVYSIQAAGSVSGDWREVGGALELVAALVVNSPGFPIPSPALAASAGRAVALVASGIVRDPEPEDTDFDSRVRAVVAATARETRAAVAAGRVRAGRAASAQQRLAASRARERGQRAQQALARMER